MLLHIGFLLQIISFLYAFFFGVFLLIEDYILVPKLKKRAIKDRHAISQYKLAGLYATGDTKITQNHKKAFLWYKKSAEQGNDEAEYQLGAMYLDDYNVSNFNKAIELFERSAAQGNEKAKGMLKLVKQ